MLAWKDQHRRNLGLMFLDKEPALSCYFLSFSRSDCYKNGGSLMNVYLGFKYFLSFHEIFISYLTMGTSSDFCLLFLSKDKAGSQSFFLFFLFIPRNVQWGYKVLVFLSCIEAAADEGRESSILMFVRTVLANKRRERKRFIFHSGFLPWSAAMMVITQIFSSPCSLLPKRQNVPDRRLHVPWKSHSLPSNEHWLRIT